MKFSASVYKKACSDYKSNWKARDAALYKLCKKFPGHERRDGSNAKLWLIGRAYATGIERRIKSAGTQGSAMEQLSAYFWRRRKSIDKIIKSLRNLKEPLTLAKLEQVADAHGRLLRIVQDFLKKGECPRSFVSKYLHFHNPAVPIFDSVVISGMRQLYPHRRDDGSLRAAKIRDQKYRSFLIRFWWLYNASRSAGATPTVRSLDYYLLCLEEEK